MPFGGPHLGGQIPRKGSVVRQFQAISEKNNNANIFKTKQRIGMRFSHTNANSCVKISFEYYQMLNVGGFMCNVQGRIKPSGAPCQNLCGPYFQGRRRPWKQAQLCTAYVQS